MFAYSLIFLVVVDILMYVFENLDILIFKKPSCEVMFTCDIFYKMHCKLIKHTQALFELKCFSISIIYVVLCKDWCKHMNELNPSNIIWKHVEIYLFL